MVATDKYNPFILHRGGEACHYRYYFFTVNGTNKFVFVSNAVTWKEAQSYCRQHYTDLAVIRSATENNQLSAITINNAWIGLFRDVWKWSYSTNVSVAVLTWMSGQPDMTGTIRPCAVVYPSGVIDDQPCSTLSSFICMDHCKFHVCTLQHDLQITRNSILSSLDLYVLTEKLIICYRVLIVFSLCAHD